MADFSHTKQERELKQAGALEAAADPGTHVTAADAERVIVEESKKAGAPAFTFNPDASTADKAAAASEAMGPSPLSNRKPKATGIVSDVDTGGPPDFDLPDTSKAKAIDESQLTGPVTKGKRDPDEAYYPRVGGPPKFVKAPEEEYQGPNLLDHQDIVSASLDEKWFGDWYYNAATIIFATLGTYITTLLGGGLLATFIIMAFCATYYRTSLRRIRRNFRTDIIQQQAKSTLEKDVESLEWINAFMTKFWPIFYPWVGITVIKAVDEVLKQQCPPFLSSLSLSTFTLGTKPPRLDHVKTYAKTDVNIVQMDWTFSFDPTDTIDMTQRQLKDKVNPKVALEARFGKKGIASTGMTVIVEDFALSGTMRIRFKLQVAYPFIERAEVCFLQRPKIDYVCKPIGGSKFGFDINFIPGLEGFIQEQIHGNLGPMMYYPNVFPIEVAKILSGNAMDQAIGVVQVTLHGGKGLKNPDKFPGIPDPYVDVKINNRDSLGRTKTVTAESNPRWNETINVIVTSLHDNLTLYVYDYNEYRKDKELGVATFTLEKLEHESEHENQSLEVLANGRPHGVIECDVRFFPVLEGHKNADGTEGPVPESNTGIAKITIEQARELDGTENLTGSLNPYATLLLNGKAVHKSKTEKQRNNPVWDDATKEFLITDRRSAKIGLIIQDEIAGTDPVLGRFQDKLEDMIIRSQKDQEWYRLSDNTTGKVKILLEWKPVALKGDLGSGGYVTPIGVMRLHFRNARDLRNVETMSKSDPYVRVLQSGIEMARTVTFDNDLNPDWDEVCYVPMHSARERLLLEVMDAENFGKDRSLGSVEINAADYLHQADNGAWLVHDEKREHSEPLRMGAKTKGTLNFTCAFYPVHDVVDPEEEAEEAKQEAEAMPNGAVRTSTDAGAESTRKSTDSKRGAISSLHKNTASVEAAQHALGGETTEEPELNEPPPKLRLTADDLPKYETGLLVFKLLDAELVHGDCRVEVLMDDMLFPSFRSSRAKTSRNTFNETGDAIVRELDVSRITVRLRRKGETEDDKDSTLAKLTGSTLDVLQQGLFQSHWFNLKGEDGRTSSIQAHLKYLPIDMKLDPSESINNMGRLRVDVLDATDLPAADRNGFSDPYCKFNLNGRDVFKTNIQKKTLHPAWNEFFEVPVPSRTGAKLRVECWDWDRAGGDDSLGAPDLNLQILEPLVAQELTFGLDGKSGAVRLRMLFTPEFVTRRRQGTASTFSGTFAPAGKIIGAPVKGVGKGAVLVGGGVVRGASFMTRGFKRRGKSGTGDEVTSSEAPSMPTLNEANASSPAPRGASEPPVTPQHAKHDSYGNDSLAAAGGANVGKSPGGTEYGTMTIKPVSATGYTGDHVHIFIKQPLGRGLKEVFKSRTGKATGEELQWNEGETCRVTGPVDTEFIVTVKDVHTFGKDETLGEGTLQLTGESSQAVQCGNGSVNFETSFTALPQTDTNSLLSSRDSPNRLRKLMPGGRASREVTPAPEGM